MRVIKSIFWKISDGIAGWAERESLRSIALFFGKVFSAIGITLFLMFPAGVFSHLWNFLSSFHFFATKFAFSVFLVWKILPSIRKRYVGDSTGVVEGVPLYELVDHIIEHGSFRRDDIESKFAIPRNRYQTLAKKLDDALIFDRGENNMRVLGQLVTREDIAKALRCTPPPEQVFGISETLKLWLSVLAKPFRKPNGNELETEWKRTKISPPK